MRNRWACTFVTPVSSPRVTYSLMFAHGLVEAAAVPIGPTSFPAATV
jgi:hypothetical protein